jgi:isoprenylcysteine carboxyl methyltransferase (ICMT) family protein YpbQ
MYYPEGQRKQIGLKSAVKYLLAAIVLIVADGFFWNWPPIGLPLGIGALILCVISLESLQRRWAIALMIIDLIFVVLTLINIGVRVYLAYLG